MKDEMSGSNGCQRFVTVVSGLPRSGTSMMMRMLEVGGMPVITDSIRTADEDNPRGYYEFEPVKRTARDASWLTGAEGKAVKMVYQLVYDLPTDYRYRLLFMRRNMEELLASQKKMLQRSGTTGADVSDAKIAELFQKQLAKFDSWVERQEHLEMLDVSYNDLVRTPARPVEAINAFLGGHLDTRQMCRVVEPKLYRNRR